MELCRELGASLSQRPPPSTSARKPTTDEVAHMEYFLAVYAMATEARKTVPRIEKPVQSWNSAQARTMADRTVTYSAGIPILIFPLWAKGMSDVELGQCTKITTGNYQSAKKHQPQT